MSACPRFLALDPRRARAAAATACTHASERARGAPCARTRWHQAHGRVPQCDSTPPRAARARRRWHTQRGLVTQRTRPACRLRRYPRAHGSPRGGGPQQRPSAALGAAPSIAPTPSSRRPRPPSTGAEEGRSVQRRRRAAAAPRVHTHDQMRAAASTAADRALMDRINDASSGEEEEAAQRLARRNVGLDDDFEDDVAPSPARPRRSTRGGRA